ncbi:4-hydroxy-3-methylbut-2-enyl diphosphate reductase [Actinorhabdospora filicis]|uniref:4-hydroxy-3-methylbut-2-enyl diphosphate reductase n=1 Tax=Actinorhabdospora filicis TaxID=1785913 RepID=A0A9W6SL51_9ACTN|nr:4-hydroxy-3-methylbut-2-enyl diphosphate reductase [Actinorhabdospora filicis]GLZ77925.1 4-hydroxy-3-methylbut-2-enyl diphosphate reductase [Actinorhabdospora filicis]
MKVLLADPRGFCAGVERAVLAVERALELYGPPVYVRHQIVHNRHVVAALERKGAIFVETTEEVPLGAVVVFSAHGVAPTVHDEAAARSLTVVDATCPLVAKVHREARRFADEDYDIVLIGHKGHEEVTGTIGEAPDRIQLVGGPEDVPNVKVRDENRVVWLSQTTLSVDEAARTVDALGERFPALTGPPGEDICYATQNRQDAVKRIAPESGLVLVVGSPNSSNSLRLVEVARASGAGAAYLIDGVAHLREGWLDGVDTVGVTAGASAPEDLVEEVVAWLVERGGEVSVVTTTRENQYFAPPRFERREGEG